MIGVLHAIVREGTIAVAAVVDAAAEEEVAVEVVVVVVEGEEIFRKDVVATIRIPERVKRRVTIHQQPLVQSI